MGLCDSDDRCGRPVWQRSARGGQQGGNLHVLLQPVLAVVGASASVRAGSEVLAVGGAGEVLAYQPGQAQHIVGNYRPRSTLLLLSRLVGEHFAGTPYGEHFATSGD